MTEPAAVHYEVEHSPTGEPPWFLIGTAASLPDAQRLAKEAPFPHTRIRKIVAAKSAEVER